MASLVQYLPLLACGLMMLVCVVPMLRGKKGDSYHTQDTTGGQMTAEQARARIAQLQREELALREQLVEQAGEQVQTEIRTSPPPSTTVHE